MKKAIIIGIILVLCCILLISCNTKYALPFKHSLTTEQIEIYLLGTEEPLVITDPDDIATLQNSVKFEEWHKSNAMYEGVETIFIEFNEDTVISMYGNEPYGQIGTGPVEVDMENLVIRFDSKRGYYDMSEEFLQTVNQMVDKYSD